VRVCAPIDLDRFLSSTKIQPFRKFRIFFPRDGFGIKSV
jgi:hypothetical protein